MLSVILAILQHHLVTMSSVVVHSHVMNWREENTATQPYQSQIFQVVIYCFYTFARKDGTLYNVTDLQIEQCRVLEIHS